MRQRARAPAPGAVGAVGAVGGAPRAISPAISPPGYLDEPAFVDKEAATGQDVPSDFRIGRRAGGGAGGADAGGGAAAGRH
ncbi:hypothetical protein KNE206_36340 [Kitasatospora sp. NE20-6]